jgi:hypothetical protein
MKEAKRSHGQIDLSLLPASTWLSLQPWRWKWYVQTTGLSELHSITVQNTVLFIVITMRIKSNTVFTLACGVTDVVSFLFQNNLAVFLQQAKEALCHKAIWGSEGIAPPFLTLALNEGEWSASRRGNCPWHPLNSRLGEPQSQSGHGVEEKNLAPARMHSNSYRPE